MCDSSIKRLTTLYALYDIQTVSYIIEAFFSVCQRITREANEKRLKQNYKPKGFFPFPKHKLPVCQRIKEACQTCQAKRSTNGCSWF